MEKLSWDCELLQQHIAACHRRLDEQTSVDLSQDDHDLPILQQRYSNLLRISHTVQLELNEAQNQLRENEIVRSKQESDLTDRWQDAQQRAVQLESHCQALQSKYDHVCEQLKIAAFERDQLNSQLAESSRQYEELLKDKVMTKSLPSFKRCLLSRTFNSEWNDSRRISFVPKANIERK